jgi:myo-inositol-1-phosphate synthase
MEKLGVAIIGVNGAVASTLVAGVELMKRGLAPKVGMVTETESPSDGRLTDLLDFVPLEGIEFGGWDLQFPNLWAAATHHGVFTEDKLRPLREVLEPMAPWPAVFSGEYAENAKGENIVKVDGGFRAEVAQIQADLERFKTERGLDRVVMLNLASTEKYLELEEVHRTLAAFEKGLDENDPAIAPAMRYFYAAAKLGIPHCNFAPSLTHIPALAELAEETQTPYAGMDGKTGQTLLKTTLAAMFRTRRLGIDGWYSVNFLGNNDGLVLDSPSSNKTKVLSKQSVLDSIVGYRVENHQVHIHYYKPRGDAKEAWDNIDIKGFAGVPMQMKINFLCQDSILAAPLCVDLVRLLDVAKQKGERGIQRQLSLFFKSPYAGPGETPEHDLFKQEAMLVDWAREHADHKG